MHYGYVEFPVLFMYNLSAGRNTDLILRGTQNTEFGESVMSTVTELMLSIRENTNGLNFWDREESETS